MPRVQCSSLSCVANGTAFVRVRLLTIAFRNVDLPMRAFPNMLTTRIVSPSGIATSPTEHRLDFTILTNGTEFILMVLRKGYYMTENSAQHTRSIFRAGLRAQKMNNLTSSLYMNTNANGYYCKNRCERRSRKAREGRIVGSLVNTWLHRRPSSVTEAWYYDNQPTSMPDSESI